MIIVISSFYSQIHTPMSIEYRPTVIEVAPGTNSKAVAAILERNNLINSANIFKYLTIFTGKADKIQAGEYKLSPDMAPQQILDVLTEGKVLLYSATIPEGFNLNEIADLLAKKQFADKKKFISLAYDKDFIKYLGIKTDSLEGYLFPDTYYFSKDASEYEILRQMMSNFKKIITPVFMERVKKIGFTEHQVVTLASLIEKETGREDERELISAVFHNRLKKRMKLQCDPTVIYALKDRFDGNLHKRDLMIDSPYNTYRYYGLPPGPIASPGKESIESVLSPADVDYLYFVSKQDGSHYFSSDLRTHVLAVKKYQLRR